LTKSVLWGVETAAQQVAQEVMGAVPSTLASVALWDQPSFALTVKAVSTARPLSPPVTVGARVSLSDAPWHRWVFEHEESVLLDQASPGRTMSRAEADLTLVPELRTIFLMPIQVAGEIVGILTLGEMRSPGREPFGADKQRQCLAALEQAIETSAPAWEAGRLRRQVRVMSALIQIVRHTLQARSYEDILATLSAKVSDWLGAPVRGILLRAYPEGMAVVARWQLPEAAVEGDAGQLLLAMARSVGGHRGPATVVRVAEDPLDPMPAVVVDAERWTRVTLPLLQGDRLLGVICLYVEDDLRPASWELEALRWIAEVTTVWMDLMTALIEHRQERDWLKVAAWELLTTHQRAVVHEVLVGMGKLLAGTLPARLELVAHELNGGLEEDAERRRRLAVVVIREIDAVVEELRSRAAPDEANGARPLELGVLVRRAIEIVLARWQAHASEVDAPVDVELEPSEPIVVRGSVAFLGVLAHAIGNAVEAAGDGGRVRVHLGRKDEQVMITIADTGPGVPEDLRRDVFAPFVSTKGRPHLGLGLPVVRTWVERHGGSVEIGTGPGGGTVLQLHLPVLLEALPARRA
jgi:signal transduction histidine kinase